MCKAFVPELAYLIKSGSDRRDERWRRQNGMHGRGKALEVRVT